VNPSGAGWNAVYPAAQRLLATDIGRSVVAASYAGVFVDEYQDCSPEQHSIVCALATILPVRVLGDPLQAIFAFRGAPVKWSRVEADFPPSDPLTTPWRWKETNPKLGDWLISIRTTLERREPLMLEAHDPVLRIPSNELADKHLLALATSRDSVVAFRKWESDTHAVASRLGGAYLAIETVDCKDLAALARRLDLGDRRKSLIDLLDLFRRSGVGMNDRLTQAIGQLSQGQRVGLEDWPKLRDALARYYSTGEPRAVIDAVDAFIEHPSVRRFRAELLEELVYAATAVSAGDCGSYGEAAWLARDQTRRAGRRPDLRVISRTLLVKGLEFDHAVVLDPLELTAQDLYVALTRGSRSVAIASAAGGAIRYGT
jgi:DNA helicase-2/ATP-dependent DNA helicase PcrA